MAKISAKISVLIGLILISLVGCDSLPKNKDPEIMYDLASRLKHLATAVDGLVKFADGDKLSKDELLLAAVKNEPSKLRFLEGYTTKVKIEGNNTAMLICRNETAVVEDAGCTAASDVQHWQASQPVACVFTLTLAQICQ